MARDKYSKVTTDPDGDSPQVKSDGTDLAMVVMQNTAPLPPGAATNGGPVTGEALEAGGSAILGWLSSLRKKLALLTDLIVTGAATAAKGLRVFIGPTDPISDVPVFLDFTHHQLHEGETHQYTYPPTALGSGSSLDHRIVVGNLTPTTRTPHAVVEVDATAETWVYLYETPTTTNDGVQQTTYNRNRNSVTVPGSTVWLSPTVSVVGTLLSAWVVGAGNKTGGNARESLEWDLKANTVYLVRVTAKATGDSVCARIIFYEDLGV